MGALPTHATRAPAEVDTQPLLHISADPKWLLRLEHEARARVAIGARRAARQPKLFDDLHRIEFVNCDLQLFVERMDFGPAGKLPLDFHQRLITCAIGKLSIAELL